MRKDAEDFLRTKKKIEKEFRDNEIRDWGCSFMIAVIFIIFLIGIISLIP